MERVDQCEGYDVLQARGAARWAVYRGARGMGACDECGSPLDGPFRLEVQPSSAVTRRCVCVHHPIGVTVPRVVGTDIEGVPAPRPGSYGAMRIDAIAKAIPDIVTITLTMIALLAFALPVTLSLTACTDHHTVVCAEGRDESVCFDDAELATVVALNDCIDTRAIPVATAPTYDDLVIACAARAIATHTPSSAPELWRKLVVVYSHADDAPYADDDLNRALHYLCTRARLEHCDRYDEAMAFAGASPTTFAAGGAA